MNELTEICGLEQSVLDTMTLVELRLGCRDLGQALAVTDTEFFLLIGAVVLGFVVPVVHRTVLNWIEPNTHSGPDVGWRLCQGMVYGLVGTYFGLTGGLFIAELVPVWFIAGLAFLFAGTTVLGAIAALINLDGNVAGKIIGFIVLLGVAALFAWGGAASAELAATDGAGVAAEYESYLNACAIIMALVGGFTGIVGGDYNVYFYGTGLLTVPIGVTWGFLGSIAGVTMHIGAWLMGRDFGDFDPDCENTLFHCYRDGPRIAGSRPFSQGPVVSASHHMWHEGTHVLQHYLFGPLYFLSYLLWLIVGGLVGALTGWVYALVKKDVAAWGDAIMGAAYMSNPWEVWAYALALDGSSDPRTLGHSGYILGTVAAWIVTVLFILGLVAGFVVWAVLVAQGKV